MEDELTVKIYCPSCNGCGRHGWWIFRRDCEWCAGTGFEAVFTGKALALMDRALAKPPQAPDEGETHK